MQTAVEWFAIQLYERMEMKGDGRVFDELLEQANKMFEQQIIDAFDEGQEYEYQYHINGAPKFDSETYFAETYGSKGSDDHIVDTNEMVEISDEEIEKQALIETNKYVDSHTSHKEIRQYAFAKGFTICAKWYREQLKKKI